MIIGRINATKTTTPSIGKGVIGRINTGPALQPPNPQPIQITPTQKKVDLKQLVTNVISTVKTVKENLIKKVAIKGLTFALSTAINPPTVKEVGNKVWKTISPEPLVGLEPGTITLNKLKTPEGRKDLATGINNFLGGLGFATLPSAGVISQLQKLPALSVKNIITGSGLSLGVTAGTTALAGEKQNWWNNAFATVLGGYFGALIPAKEMTMKQAVISDAKGTLEKYGINNNADYRAWAMKNHPDIFPKELRPQKEIIWKEVNSAIKGLADTRTDIGKIPNPPSTLNDAIKWASDTWLKITNPPSKTGRSIVPYKVETPIETVILPGQYTPQEVISKVIGNKLETTAEGKQILKVVAEANNTGQSIVVDKVVEQPLSVPTKGVPQGVGEVKPQITAPTPPVSPIVEKVSGGEVKPKVISVPRENLPVGEGKVKASKLEARLKGVIGQATEEQIKNLGLSTYNVMNKAEQITKASQYVVNNQEEALSVLQGLTEPPKGIIPESIYVAMTTLAKDDLTLATKLATLPATAIGQRISILTEIDKDNPVKLLNEVYKIREAEFKKRTGKTIKEATKNEVERIKKEIKIPDKYDWGAFLDSVECK